jgi:hypothetical protein
LCFVVVARGWRIICSIVLTTQRKLTSSPGWKPTCRKSKGSWWIILRRYVLSLIFTIWESRAFHCWQTNFAQMKLWTLLSCTPILSLFCSDDIFGDSTMVCLAQLTSFCVWATSQPVTVVWRSHVLVYLHLCRKLETISFWSSLITEHLVVSLGTTLTGVTRYNLIRQWLNLVLSFYSRLGRTTIVVEKLLVLSSSLFYLEIIFRRSVLG